MQQRLCTTLYDSMRPLVIRIHHLETLSELCAIFRVEMLEDVVAHNRMISPYFQSLSQMFSRMKHINSLSYERFTVQCALIGYSFPVAYDVSAFGEVCTAVLADVQERFVYRAHTYIRDEVLNYRPAPGDLAYPHKLLMMQVGLFSWLLLLSIELFIEYSRGQYLYELSIPSYTK